jgi:hypothetical protein
VMAVMAVMLMQLQLHVPRQPIGPRRNLAVAHCRTRGCRRDY